MRIIAAAIAFALACAGAQAQERPSIVNFSMVVAVDFSSSMELRETRLIQRALAGALRDRPFVQEVSAGCGAFAVVSFWEDGTEVLHPWRVLCSPPDALRLADEVETANWPNSSGSTNPWVGIKESLDYFLQAPPARRSMLNVVGDGAQLVDDVPGAVAVPGTVPGGRYYDYSPAFEALKLRAVQMGVMINALAVEPHKVEWFYENEVVTGFVVPAQTYQDAVRAMRVKFQMELAAASQLGVDHE